MRKAVVTILALIMVAGAFAEKKVHFATWNEAVVEMNSKGFYGYTEQTFKNGIIYYMDVLGQRRDDASRSTRGQEIYKLKYGKDTLVVEKNKAFITVTVNDDKTFTARRWIVCEK